MICIFCDEENTATSIEHIVSEGFGNKDYVAEISRVCDVCNNRFSDFEGRALSNSIFVMERARFAIATKKGKNAKGKVGEFTFEGDKDFKKNLITIYGMTEDNFINYDPKTNTGNIIVKAFDKSEVASSKLLLKMGLSALFTSQRKIFTKYEFSDLKNFLRKKSNLDWPFITSDFEVSKFMSIPKFLDKHKLSKLRCYLSYHELNSETLLFMFKFGSIPMVINLLNRNINWIPLYLEHDKLANLYPEHYRNKPLISKHFLNGERI